MPDVVSGGVGDYTYQVEIVSDQYVEISAFLDTINQNIEKNAEYNKEIEKKLKTQNEKIDTLQDTVSGVYLTVSGSAAESSASVPPDDYYSFMTDTQGQIVFFLSLLLGVMICYIFTVNFNRH